MTNAQHYLEEIAWLITDRDKYRNALLHGIANLDDLCAGCEICEFIKGLHEAKIKHDNQRNLSDV